MIYKKKVLVVIPARGGSKGIKLKNLRKINKKSLLQITINFAKSLGFVDQITVSSDHFKILKIAKKNKIFSTIRNKKLAGDRVGDFDVLKHAIKNVEEKTLTRFDIIIYLQPTSPFRKLKDVKKATKIMIRKKCDSIWSVSEASCKYHPNKMLELSKVKRLKLYTKRGEKILARQQLSNIFIRNGLFYIFNKKKLLNEKKIYLRNMMPFITKHRYVNIDDKKDLKISKLLARKEKYNF